jgi:hypothetical protein
MAEIHAALRDHTTGRVTLWRNVRRTLILRAFPENAHCGPKVHIAPQR